MSGTGKSFRTSKDRELIRLDKKQAYIMAEGQKRHTKVHVEFKLEEDKKKQVKVNGLVLTKVSDLLNNIHVVIFSPEDLKLVKEGPVERRKFMDTEISNIKPRYYHDLGQYHRVLMQRNNLLKRIYYEPKFKGTLEVWDEKLVELGTRLIMERKRFVQKLNSLSRLLHRKITDNKETLEVRYMNNGFDTSNDDQIYINFHNELKKTFEVDVKKGATTIGPHRDDLAFYVNGIDIRVFGSQGQQRTSALALKLAEIEIIKAETAEYPILLLDDVMSELDEKRQNFLMKSLRDIQIFITTTDIGTLKELNPREDYIFTVENGIVKRQ